MKCLLILLATVALAQSASIQFFPVIYGPPSGMPDLPSKTCISGEVRSADSRHWWECTNNQWVYWTCPEGTYVDMKTLKCEFLEAPSPPTSSPTSSSTSTQNPTSGYCTTPGSTQPDLFDNSRFDYCSNNHRWVKYQCPLGAVYDPKESPFCSWVTANPSSTTTTTTTNAPETWCKAGFYKENPDDCRTYYQCDNGHWRAMPCAGGTGWDQLNLTCNHIDLVCTEDFKPKSGQRPSTKKPNNNNGF